MKVASLALCAIACGSPAHPAPPSNHASGAGPGATTDQAIAMLHQLAAVVRADGSLAPLADPGDGVWLWEQPGVAPQPTAHAAPGDAHKLSEVLASGGLDGARADNWMRGLADELEHGTTVMDVDADAGAAAYNVNCDPARGDTAAARAVLLTKGVALTKEHQDLDPGGPISQMKAPIAAHFIFNAVEVYFSVRGGVLYVADVIVSTPCEA